MALRRAAAGVPGRSGPETQRARRRQIFNSGLLWFKVLSTTSLGFCVSLNQFLNLSDSTFSVCEVESMTYQAMCRDLREQARRHYGRAGLRGCRAWGAGQGPQPLAVGVQPLPPLGPAPTRPAVPGALTAACASDQGSPGPHFVFLVVRAAGDAGPSTPSPGALSGAKRL